MTYIFVYVGDQVVVLICCSPTKDSSDNVDFNIAPQNAVFVSRACSFEELKMRYKIV